MGSGASEAWFDFTMRAIQHKRGQKYQRAKRGFGRHEEGAVFKKLSKM